MRDKKSNKEIIAELFAGRVKEEELTEVQRTYYTRVRAIYAKLLQMEPVLTYNEIVNILVVNHGVGERTAYRLIKDAEHLFGDFQKANKNILRMRAQEMALQAYNVALKQKRGKDMAAAVKAYIDAGGLNREDADLPDFKNLEPHLLIMLLPEEQKQLLNSLLSQGVLNLNKVPQTIDIQHEEVE
jgi:hypothetical protein